MLEVSTSSAFDIESPGDLTNDDIADDLEIWMTFEGHSSYYKRFDYLYLKNIAYTKCIITVGRRTWVIIFTVVLNHRKDCYMTSRARLISDS